MMHEDKTLPFPESKIPLPGGHSSRSAGERRLITCIVIWQVPDRVLGAFYEPGRLLRL